MNPSDNLKQILEAALLAAGRPVSLDELQNLFDEMERPEKKALRTVLGELAEEYEGRGIEVVEVASGWRIQVRKECAPWVSRLWEEKPGRYSRALMETLALIAYRQPITRGEIEEIRGVSVSSNIIRTLLEREWVRVVGHRDVPGRPALYGTTREFLDYFGLKSLDDLPALSELKDIDSLDPELELPEPGGSDAAGEGSEPVRPEDGPPTVPVGAPSPARTNDSAPNAAETPSSAQTDGAPETDETP